MSTAVVLRPGTPDDENRDYLPAKIKGSDIVVNENGNNSVPYPAGLREYHDTLNGVSGVWYEYLPERFANTPGLPLVLGMHGGLMTGWGQAVYTSWVYAAEKYGFICVFPDAHTESFWEIEISWEEAEWRKRLNLIHPLPPPKIEDNHDCRFVFGLIGRMREKYRIDTGRIFMQGMSAGNKFTHFFARYYGSVLAGAAGSGACQSYSLLFDNRENLINEGGPLPVWQSRPDENAFGTERSYQENESVNDYNREYWLRVNGCADPVPQIKTEGEKNFLFYRCRNGDVVYMSIKNRDHGQTLDDAFYVWEYLFSGCRREEDGTLSQGKSVLERCGDRNAIAFIAGADKVYFRNRIVCLHCRAAERGKAVLLPLGLLADAGGCSVSRDGRTVKLCNGANARFSAGQPFCDLDGSMLTMDAPAESHSDGIHVSALWFLRYLLNWHISCADGVMYATDHYAELTYDTAQVLRRMLTKDQLIHGGEKNEH